jgi:hypothetical protein
MHAFVEFGKSLKGASEVVGSPQPPAVRLLPMRVEHLRTAAFCPMWRTSSESLHTRFVGGLPAPKPFDQ